MGEKGQSSGSSNAAGSSDLGILGAGAAEKHFEGGGSMGASAGVSPADLGNAVHHIGTTPPLGSATMLGNTNPLANPNAVAGAGAQADQGLQAMNAIAGLVGGAGVGSVAQGFSPAVDPPGSGAQAAQAQSGEKGQAVSSSADLTPASTAGPGLPPPPPNMAG